jgi:hypothetical protein
LPIPGALLVFAVLFVNLFCALIAKFSWKVKSFGTLLCHIGILLLLLGSLLTFLYSTEGFVAFMPGEVATEFTSNHTYEFCAIYELSPGLDKIIAFPQSMLLPGKKLGHKSLPFEIEIIEYYKNCDVQGTTDIRVQPVTEESDIEKNWPACVVKINLGNDIQKISLPAFVPAEIFFREQKYTVLFTKQKNNLPFSIQLLDTKREYHPGTQIPKSFQSKILVSKEGTPSTEDSREVLIRMNHPFRYQGYTFYQSGFEMQKGRPVSTLAVVNNPFSTVPYLSCFVIFFGMCIHFLQKLLVFLKRKSNQ